MKDKPPHHICDTCKWVRFLQDDIYMACVVTQDYVMPDNYCDLFELNDSLKKELKE